MESKIIIDLDFDNQPVIVINYKSSDDVRDKMIKRFIQDSADQQLVVTYSGFHDKQKVTLRPDNAAKAFKETGILPNKESNPSPIQPQNVHIENVNHITGMMYAFCKIKDTQKISMILTGDDIWFETQGPFLTSLKLDRQYLVSLNIIDLARLIVTELDLLLSKIR